MRKAGIWQAFLIQRRIFSETRTAWLGREDTQLQLHRTQLLETTCKTGATRGVCSSSVQQLARADATLRAAHQRAA